MLDLVLLNVVFIAVPVLIYLLYIVYDNVIDNKGKDLFFAFSIFTSIYLITKYSLYFEYTTDIIKILLLICLLKNKIKLSVVISLFICLYFGYINNYDILVLLVQHFIQISIFIILVKTNIKYKLFIFLIIEILFGILFNYDSYINVVVLNSIYIISSYIIFTLLVKLEKVIDIYGTIRVVEYEKEFRNSLFEVTHEIKNPIAVCKGYIDMLDTNNKKQVNKYIPIIKEEIDRTLTLMNDFLNLTKLSINKNIIDIALLLDDVCNCIEAFICNKNIHFMFDIVDDEVFIDGDYDRLKQVFINLIKNSVEAIDKDKIGIIKLKMVVNKKVFITLTDNGCGMSKDTIENIGNAFYTTKEKGTGLGVKLSSEIIEQHDGKIKYKSKLNQGTTVKIELPLMK
jgi:signal transduction histidine kinase